MNNDLDKFRPQGDEGDNGIQGGSGNYGASPSSSSESKDSKDTDSKDTDNATGGNNDDSNHSLDKDSKDSESSDKDSSDSDDKDSDSKDDDSDNKDDKDDDKDSKDDKDGKDNKSGKDKLKDKLLGKKHKKTFKDFLKEKKQQNKQNELQKMKNLTSKLAKTIQKLFSLLKLYTQAMQAFALFKAIMLAKSIISTIWGWLQTAWAWITGAWNAAVGFVGGIFGGIATVIGIGGGALGAIGSAVIGAVIAIVALFVFMFASDEQQKHMVDSTLYNTLCKNRKAKDDDEDSDSGGGGSANTAHGKKHKLKPLKFKDYKDHFKNAKSLSKAVAKEAGIKPEWAFAQIMAEESTYITGGTLQPVVTQDHNLTGMGPVGVSFGTGHAEGDGGYGHYQNYHQFAAAWAWWLKTNLSKKEKSGSAHDYVLALKKHGYFTADAEEYYSHFASGLSYYKNGKGGGGATSATGSEKEEEESDTDKALDKLCGVLKKETSGKWGWPFKGMTYSKAMSTITGAQRFGHTGGGRTNGYHDGIDLGTHPYNKQKIRAIHAGTVKQIGFKGHTQNDLGGYVWVHNDKDGYNVIYQEFVFNSSEKNKAIKVKVGQHVDVGDTIGILDESNTDVSHVHIGVTKKSFNYAIGHSYDSGGGWKDPIKVIHEGLNNKDSGSGSDSGMAYGHLSKAQDAARREIVKAESGGSYTAVNGKYYGKYQLDKRYLSMKEYHGDGTTSKRNQERVAYYYVKERYGSWTKALKFRHANNWY